MIILLIIILIFVFLLLGIRLTLQWIKTGSEYDGCLKILIFKKLKIYTLDLKSDEDDESEDDADDEKSRDFKEIYKLAKPCFEYFKEFLYKAITAVSINKLENHLVIGFSSFAKTGEYIGYIWIVTNLINANVSNSKLTAEPSFRGSTLDFKGSANIDISILKLIVPASSLLLKKEVRTLIKGVMNG